jgi:hypothetical protein
VFVRARCLHAPLAFATDGSAARLSRRATCTAWSAPERDECGGLPLPDAPDGGGVRVSRQSARGCALRVNDPSAGSPTER